MSKLREKLNADYIAAMKNKDTERKEVIQLVRAGVLQIEKDKQIEADDATVISVVQKEVRNRRELIDEVGADRPDVKAKTEAEIAVLEEYLPKQLSEAELKEVVEAKVKELGAESMRDMGRVMKAVLAEVAGQAEGGDVSRIVKSILS